MAKESNWRDALGGKSATDVVAGQTARRPRAVPAEPPKIVAMPPVGTGAVVHNKYHKYPPAYGIDIITKKPITMCCICNAKDPTDRYVVILQGKPEGDSAAVEAAYEKLAAYTGKLK